MISGSVVRTTLRSKISLRFIIIVFFLAGAIAGAYLFHEFRFPAFLFPAALLLLTLVYDMLRIKLKRYYRRAFPLPHP